jgi:ASCH domain
VTDWKHHPVCPIQTTEVNTVPFREIDAQFAYDYGEGERALVWLKPQLWDYYVQECTLIGRQATEEMPLVGERFQVVYQRCAGHLRFICSPLWKCLSQALLSPPQKQSELTTRALKSFSVKVSKSASLSEN